MELGEPDASGRRRPVPIKGSETLMDLDMIICAIGQGPDISFKDDMEALDDLRITRWNTIEPSHPETLQSSIPNLFTGGDAATGASLVVEAIGGGRRAARSIHQYLMDDKAVAPAEKSLFKKHIAESLFEAVDGVSEIPRAKMPELPVTERIQTFEEVDLVIEEDTAHAESCRCLNCCRLCYNQDKDTAAA
jgi:NADPH-dependent glutamate synthase beta subunit-like oxidoreductase